MDYRFSTDCSEMNLDIIHQFLSNSYWSKGISKEVVEKSLRHSLCFAAFVGESQVGFGRFITDRATFAYLADVFVVDEHQGQGIGKRMMADAFALSDVQGLRRMMLATSTAHTLYEQYGFSLVQSPETLMEKFIPDIYSQQLT